MTNSDPVRSTPSQPEQLARIRDACEFLALELAGTKRKLLAAENELRRLRATDRGRRAG